MSIIYSDGVNKIKLYVVDNRYKICDMCSAKYFIRCIFCNAIRKYHHACDDEILSCHECSFNKLLTRILPPIYMYVNILGGNGKEDYTKYLKCLKTGVYVTKDKSKSKISINPEYLGLSIYDPTYSDLFRIYKRIPIEIMLEYINGEYYKYQMEKFPFNHNYVYNGGSIEKYKKDIAIAYDNYVASIDDKYFIALGRYRRLCGIILNCNVGFK
jgi:hypothetical protein